MILLDENINEDQRKLLAAWNIRVKQIGVEVETKAVTDERIISVLHDFKNCLFLSSDSDFWDRKYCHSNYCLVYMDVERNETAFFIRKFLKHAAFDTIKKRLGKVVKVSQTTLSYFETKNAAIKKVSWK